MSYTETIKKRGANLQCLNQTYKVKKLSLKRPKKIKLSKFDIFLKFLCFCNKFCERLSKREQNTNKLKLAFLSKIKIWHKYTNLGKSQNGCIGICRRGLNINRCISFKPINFWSGVACCCAIYRRSFSFNKNHVGRSVQGHLRRNYLKTKIT